MNNEEYEMPAEYQARLKTLLELIEERDEYARIFPSLLPDERRKAQPLIDEFSRNINTLEQLLAEEYESYQTEQRRQQELYELTYLQETMSEELFIIVKHRHPHVFKEFEEYATRDMTDEERRQQYAIIARREAAELDDILSGKKTAPEYRNRFIKFVLPQDQMDELFTELYLVAFETDDFYKETLEVINQAVDARREFIFSLSRSLPVRRENLEKRVVEMRDTIRLARRHLIEYFQTNQKSGKFPEIKKPDQERLDQIFKDMQTAQDRLFIVNKHTRPDIFAEFEQLVVSDFTPEEKTDFYKRIAEREEKDLKALLRSLADE